jgi:hypothetical protein
VGTRVGSAISFYMIAVKDTADALKDYVPPITFADPCLQVDLSSSDKLTAGGDLTFTVQLLDKGTNLKSLNYFLLASFELDKKFDDLLNNTFCVRAYPITEAGTPTTVKLPGFAGSYVLQPVRKVEG